MKPVFHNFKFTFSKFEAKTLHNPNTQFKMHCPSGLKRLPKGGGGGDWCTLTDNLGPPWPPLGHPTNSKPCATRHSKNSRSSAHTDCGNRGLNLRYVRYTTPWGDRNHKNYPCPSKCNIQAVKMYSVKMQHTYHQNVFRQNATYKPSKCAPSKCNIHTIKMYSVKMQHTNRQRVFRQNAATVKMYSVKMQHTDRQNAFRQNVIHKPLPCAWLLHYV